MAFFKIRTKYGKNKKVGTKTGIEPNGKDEKCISA